VTLIWRSLDRLAHQGAGIAPLLAATSSIVVAFALLLATAASGASLIGDSVALNVTIIDPPDTEVFDGSATVADGPVEFQFDDIALDTAGTPKYVWDVDFLGPDGLTLTITATRNTTINDINGHFRSFEFTGLDFPGGGTLTNAVVTGLSGTQAIKWAGGPLGPAQVTAFGAGFFTFETGSWNSGGVVFGDTITATIELTVLEVFEGHVWGGETWGVLVWGGGVEQLPTLHALGLFALSALLVGAGAYLMGGRGRAGRSRGAGTTIEGGAV
jgi:hypothetical protein